MPSDVKLNGANDDWITIEGAVINAQVSDLILEQRAYRTPEGGNYRRALVHNDSDGLTINFNRDYPAGVEIFDAHLHLKVHHQRGAVKLPKNGDEGELRLIRRTFGGGMEGGPGGPVVGKELSLWLCIGRDPNRFIDPPAQWCRIPLGDAVDGTE